MKKMQLMLCGLAVLGLAAVAITPPAAAGEKAMQLAAPVQTVTFKVAKMSCAACPITVRKSMEGVKGVTAVTIDFKAKTATVVFDPAKTNIEQIATASTNAGYPAIEQKKDS